MSNELDRAAALVSARRFDEARELLDAMPAEPAIDVRRIQLALYEGTIEAGIAMQRLVQIMRQDQHTPFAKELYLEASRLELGGGRSSMAHSHPPPALRGEGALPESNVRAVADAPPPFESTDDHEDEA